MPRCSPVDGDEHFPHDIADVGELDRLRERPRRCGASRSLRGLTPEHCEREPFRGAGQGCHLACTSQALQELLDFFLSNRCRLPIGPYRYDPPRREVDGVADPEMRGDVLNYLRGYADATPSSRAERHCSGLASL